MRRDEEEEDKVVFRGWARMALPLRHFAVVEVRKPNVGEAKPATVTADVLLDTKSARPPVPCCDATSACSRALSRNDAVRRRCTVHSVT